MKAKRSDAETPKRWKPCACGSREFRMGYQAAVVDLRVTKRGTLRQVGRPHLMDGVGPFCARCDSPLEPDRPA